MKPKVYIAGPYSKGDTVINVRNAVAAADALWAVGLIPFVPHLSHLWHTISPHGWQEWLDLDLEFLPCCQALLLLPGESKGAELECERAKELVIPVYHSIPELYMDFGGE